MDRFVTRTQTWKTLNYSSMAAQSSSQKKSLTKKTLVDNKKKPLQEKQFCEVSPRLSYDFDKHLADLFHSTNKSNADILNANSNDSGLSSTSSVSPRIDENVASDNAPSNKKLLTPTKNHSCKLADYIDCPVEKENDTYMTITRTPKSQKKVVESSLQVQKKLEVNQTPDRPLPITNNIMARIQRDLNSPSAATRLKAIKAIRSPTKSAYTHFDIPEAEQTFYLPEPPSLQEIMRNIVVYVEVRSGEDNRSAGVRKVIEALGARVNLSLNRETTHVVFKDGLLSTFKKATQMNIPIVSILWIEACKNQRRICDPKDYAISNLDRYVNPELYTKMKRIKSMQPDSECNKRIRAKAGGTPKDSTPTLKTGNVKKTSTLIGGTPTSSTNKKKTDISQFFKKLETKTPSSASKADDGDISGKTTITESPASQLLKRINSECYTPLTELKKKTAAGGNKNDIQNNTDCSQMGGAGNESKYNGDVRKALNFLQAENTAENIEASIPSNMVVGLNAIFDASLLRKKSGIIRRRSFMKDCEIETATNSMHTMAISVSTPSKHCNRRRSSIHLPKDMSMAMSETPRKVKSIQPIQEEYSEVEKNQVCSEKIVDGRQTLCAAKTMDQTDLVKPATNKEVEAPCRKSARRRTLYTINTMETSEIKEVVNNKLHSNVSNRRRTCFNLKSLEQTQISELTDNKSENTSNKETKEKSKALDLTNEVQKNIKLPSTKADKPSNCRRTLYGGQKISETNLTTLMASSPNVTTGGSICQTPINFQTGKLASSTLLDDSENRGKLVATPPADATTGKLLEETEQCPAPIVFSSTRRPGNTRRSLFDVSMDIITQRLQCINQSARRSLAPPTPSAEVINTLEKPISTPIDITKSNNHLLLNSTTPKSLNEIKSDNTNGSGDKEAITPIPNTLKKKRKLFIPNEVSLSPPSARRRTLMPISQPQPTTIVSLLDSTSTTVSTPIVKKRRSTLDFEQTQNMKSKARNAIKVSSSASAVTEDPSQQQIKVKKTPVLVYTNMHQQQIDVIREAVNKLGLFVLESCVTNTTTHLVNLEPRRTLNLLRALARGCWILEYSWILDSLKADKWLPEESHEMKKFSRAVEICRSERQAFGNKYKCDLFRKFGAFYISSHCCPISKENMRELITLCGGHVVNTRQKARYIIGDANRTLEDKLYLTPFWVLDCITQMQILKVNKYLYSLTDGRSAMQLLPLEEKN